MAKVIKYLFFNYCNILIVSNKKKNYYEKNLLNSKTKFRKSKIKYCMLGKCDYFILIKQNCDFKLKK